jgi:MFS family permease
LQNSQLSALPYVALLLAGLIGAPIADKLITNEIFTIDTTRKVFTSLGCFVPAVALISLGFIDSTQKDVATGLLVMAVGSSAFTQCGYLVNPIDLSPNHAGTITGIVNCFSTIFSILGPLSVEFLGDDKVLTVLWRFLSFIIIITVILERSHSLVERLPISRRDLHRLWIVLHVFRVRKDPGVERGPRGATSQKTYGKHFFVKNVVTIFFFRYFGKRAKD